MIVDDSSIGREALADALVADDYNFLFAASGAEALAAVAGEDPEVVLLDVLMPGLSGIEVCRRLREDSPVPEVSILLVSALGDRKSRIRGLEAGADAFISKPFDRVEIRARVRSCVRLHRNRRETLERAVDASRLHAESQVLTRVRRRLRSPLVSIQRILSLLIEGVAGRTTLEQKSFLQLIGHDVRLLDRLARELSVTSYLEGKPPLPNPASLPGASSIGSELP